MIGRDPFTGFECLWAWSEKKDGPMNIVGHPTFDRDRRHNRAAFLQRMKLYLANCVTPTLTHSAHVESVSVANPDDVQLKCDALITDKVGLVLTIGMADCPPLFLYDPIKRVIALVHCGWRPLAAGIIKNTIDRMKSGYNVDPADLHAYVGPGICRNCYEVKDDVACKFHTAQSSDSERHYISLQAEISFYLKAAGVHVSRMQGSKECTSTEKISFSSEEPKYFSYRRDKKNDPLDTQMAIFMLM